MILKISFQQIPISSSLTKLHEAQARALRYFVLKRKAKRKMDFTLLDFKKLAKKLIKASTRT